MNSLQFDLLLGLLGNRLASLSVYAIEELIGQFAKKKQLIELVLQLNVKWYITESLSLTQLATEFNIHYYKNIKYRRRYFR